MPSGLLMPVPSTDWWEKWRIGTRTHQTPVSVAEWTWRKRRSLQRDVWDYSLRRFITAKLCTFCKRASHTQLQSSHYTKSFDQSALPVYLQNSISVQIVTTTTFWFISNFDWLGFIRTSIDPWEVAWNSTKFYKHIPLFLYMIIAKRAWTESFSGA